MPSLQASLSAFQSVWVCVGPLVGIYAGHILGNSAQRRQWLLDRRKEEFQEMLSAMTDAVIQGQRYLASKPSCGEQYRDNALDAFIKATRILVDRIYTAPDLDRSKIRERFLAATSELRDGGDPEQTDACEKLDQIIRELVELAHKS
jgi:hypothetical protein